MNTIEQVKEKRSLADILGGNKMHKRRLVQIEPQSFVAFNCSECDEEVGLNADFLDKVGEGLFAYTCPYCGEKLFLDND